MRAELGRIPSLFSEGIEEVISDMPSRRLQRTADWHGIHFKESFWKRLHRYFREIDQMKRIASPSKLVATAAKLGGLEIASAYAGNSRYVYDPMDGLIGTVHDLNAEGILSAYRDGMIVRSMLFGATLCAPSHRYIIDPVQAERSPEADTLYRQADLDISFDRQFENVIERMIDSDKRHYPLYPALAESLIRLFDGGKAHSLEISDAKGRLIAALIGIGIGRCFILCGQINQDSQGVRELGLHVMARQLADWGYRLIDATQITDLVSHSNLQIMSQKDFVQRLSDLQGAGKAGHWQLDSTIYHRRSLLAKHNRLFVKQPAHEDNPRVDDFAVETLPTDWIKAARNANASTLLPIKPGVATGR